MDGFVEPAPEVVAPNPGGPDDPLGESVLDPAQPGLRVFAPRDVRIVIGRNQDPRIEVLIEAAQADGIPIHRRRTGGGTVVLAPGMVVVALRLAPGAADPNWYYAAVNAALIPAVAECCGSAPACRGHGDLTLEQGGIRRKILGTSLRQTSALVAYLGVFLVADATALMHRYLPFPSKQPDYRAGRGHGEFCDHLARHGVTESGLIAALISHCTPIIDRVPTASGACLR